MIPVQRQPEPDNFDEDVRQKGLAWLNKNGIARNGPVPSKTPLPDYWRDCLDDLYVSYDKTCAYLCIYLERAAGGVTTEHFVAKSQDAGQAYEWGNYRLACSRINSRKGVHQDVLDPFEIARDMFRLECVTGRLYSNPTLSPTNQAAVGDTIARLALDNEENRTMRATHFSDYIMKRISKDYLKEKSPFVWIEADRQKLL